MTITLTPADTRAMRKATDLCFDYGSHVQSPSLARIRVISGGRGGPQAEQTYVINVESSRVDNYGPTMRDFDAFHMAMNCQHDDHVRTLIHFVKPGDRIGFRWVRNNASPVTNEAGLVRDEFYIDVARKDRRHTFLVHVAVGLDNSARMVKATR